MRAWLVCLLVASACGKQAGEGEQPEPGSGAVLSPEDEREQAQFFAERRPDKVVEALGLKPGSKVADIGAGSGLLTVHLARAVAPNGKVVATDVDDSVLKLLAQRIKAAKLSSVVEPRVAAADAPGLEPNAYDAILLAEVDHYFTDAATWLRDASKSLVPGGRLVITNRVYHKAQAMAAAKKAGLELQSESTPVPTHFIAVFVVPEVKK